MKLSAWGIPLPINRCLFIDSYTWPFTGIFSLGTVLGPDTVHSSKSAFCLSFQKPSCSPQKEFAVLSFSLPVKIFLEIGDVWSGFRMTSGIEVNSWGSKIPLGMFTEPRGLLLICAMLLGFVGRSIKYLISPHKSKCFTYKRKKKRNGIGTK